MNGKGLTFWRWLLLRLKNKYLLSILIFVLWLAFFDNSNLLDMFAIKRSITRLNNEKIYYQLKIQDDTRKINELRTNKENLEKFAREQYLMKKPNEDLFIIEEDR